MYLQIYRRNTTNIIKIHKILFLLHEIVIFINFNRYKYIFLYVATLMISYTPMFNINISILLIIILFFFKDQGVFILVYLIINYIQIIV